MRIWKFENLKIYRAGKIRAELSLKAENDFQSGSISKFSTAGLRTTFSFARSREQKFFHPPAGELNSQMSGLDQHCIDCVHPV